MNKHKELLDRILKEGATQENKKGSIVYLLNQVIDMDATDLNPIILEARPPVKKLLDELQLYFSGIEQVEAYREKGIPWWDYCSKEVTGNDLELKNSYPTYYAKLPGLIEKINEEKRPSKNYVLFIGETGVKTNQLPCLSLMQFQIVEGELYISVYQRSADSNLGLPSDIFQTYIISSYIDVPLRNITFFIGNAHIYANNIEETREFLNGKEKPKFKLNV